MPSNAENLTFLSQLDESEKSGIITDKELEEIGVAYGSRENYTEAMRSFTWRLSGHPTRRPASVPGGTGEAPPRINRATSTVPLGDIPRIKRINIVGKSISTADDASRLFSAFRDPRIEILNIVYASSDGRVLAHTAWTSGLPGVVRNVESGSLSEGLNRILSIKNSLGADKIWLAHNHPSGNPEPSSEDISTTKYYHYFFGDGFAGHIVLDHDKYSMIAPNGNHTIWKLKKPVRNFISKNRKNAAIFHSQETIAAMFKKVLSSKEAVSVIAVLDNGNKVVSWTYSDHSYVQGIKDYMRVSGGSKVIALSNDDALYKRYYTLAESVRATKNDVFLDVIKVDRVLGLLEGSLSLSQNMNAGSKWQLHESKLVKYIVNNRALQHDLGINHPSHNRAVNYNGDIGWNEDNVLIRDFKGPCLFRASLSDSPSETVLSIYDSHEALQYNSPYAKFNVPGDIESSKQLVKQVITDIMLFDNAEDLYIHDISRYLGRYIKNLNRETFAAEPLPQWQSPSLDGGNINSKENNMPDADESQGWIRSHYYQGSYRQTLIHRFGGQKTYFEVERNGYDSYGLNFYPDEKSRQLMDDFREEHPGHEDPDPGIAALCRLGFAGSRNVEKLKDHAEKTIAFFDNLFDKNQNATINDITENLDAVTVAIIKHNPLEKLQLNISVIKEIGDQVQNPSLEGGNINSKEKSMSDGLESGEPRKEKERIDWDKLDSREKDFLNASLQRKAIADALKTGTLCCLPAADGYADTMPAKNMTSDHLYHGASLLLVKQHQKENGFPTGNYLTSEKIDEAKKEVPGLFIRKDQHSVSLYSGMKNEATGEYETERHKLFNIAQTTKPRELVAWVEQEQKEAHDIREERKSVDFGSNYVKQEYASKNQPPKNDGPEIVCSSTKPEEYLGQYLVAVSLGGKFKASPEQAAEFSQKFEADLYRKVTNDQGELMLSKKTGQPFTDPFSLQKTAEKANQHCVNLIRDMKIESQKQNQPEQKLEQQQSRGHKI
jgi:hypothetical protein